MEQPQCEQVMEQPQPEQILEQPQPEQIWEQPQLEQIMEQPQPEQIMEHPQPEQIMEHPQPEQIMEQPQPEQLMEHPQLEQIVEQPQPEQIMEHPQPEQIMEQPQPEQIMEQTQPEQIMEQTQPEQIMEQTQPEQILQLSQPEEPVVQTNVYNIKNCKNFIIGDSPQSKPSETTSHQLERFDSKNYVPTRAYKQAEELMENVGIAVVIGCPGSGKTILGMSLLAHIRDLENRQVLLLTHHSQFDFLPDDNKLVVMIDDMFGRSNLVKEFQQSWELKFPRLWQLVESGLKVIITFRSQIFSECKEHLIEFGIFKQNHQIDLHGSDSSLTYQEKRDILDQHLNDMNITMKPSERETAIICAVTDLGFPQCCNFYVHSKEAQKRGDDFFNNPIEYLKQELNKIKEDGKFEYLVLLLVMFKQGIMKEDCLDPFEEDIDTLSLLKKLKGVCKINTDVSVGQIKASATFLCHVYLEYDEYNKAYSFVHQSVFDTLFLQFSSEFLKQSIKVCSFSMLMDYVVTPGCPNKGPITVMVNKDNYHFLAERFTDELKSEHARYTLSHESFKDEQFVKYLIDILWDNTILSELLSNKYDLQCYEIKRTFWQKNIDTLWNNFECTDLCLNPTYIKISSFSQNLVVSSSLVSTAVVKQCKTLSRLLVSRLCKLDVNGDVQKEILDSACIMGYTKVVDILLSQDVSPTLDSFTAAAGSQTDDVAIFKTLLNHKRDLELSLQDLGSMLFLALEYENGNISCLLIDKITGMENNQLILESAAKLLLLKCYQGIENIITFQRGTTNFKIGAVTLFKKLSRYTELLNPEVVVSLAAGQDDADILKEILKIYPSWLDTILTSTNPLLTASCYGCLDSVSILIEKGCNMTTVSMKKQTALHLAAAKHHTSVVVYILSKGADPNVLDLDNNTPLHLSVKIGSLDLVKALVEKGALVNAVNLAGQTPLHIASEKGSLQILRYLVEHESQVNIPDDDGRIPLHLATEIKLNNNMFACVEYLVECESHVNLVDNSGLTPLHLATRYSTGVSLYLLNKEADLLMTDAEKNSLLHMSVKANSLALVNELIKRGAHLNSVNALGDTPLHIAAVNNALNIAKVLVEKGSDVNLLNDMDMTPLHLAARFNPSDLALFLLQKGADPNLISGEEEYPLHISIKANSLTLTKALVEKGAILHTTDRSGMTPLEIALKKNLRECAMYLAEKGNDENSNTVNTLLHLAIKAQKVDMCSRLLSKGADPNAADTEENSPLHFAVRADSVQLVEMLVQKGANVNAVNNAGFTALHIAAEINSLECVEYLVGTGSNLKSVAHNGQLPLHLATRHNTSDVAVYLLRNGADPNVTDASGESPLHLAVKVDSLELVETLVTRGANMNAVDNSGKTPLHIAVQCSSFQLFKYLVEQGCETDKPDGNDMLPIHLIGIECTRYMFDMCLYPIARSSECSRDMSDICLYLIRNGTDPNVTDSDKNTPLHLAASSNCLDLVKTLVENKADVNALNNSKNTPLHYAAKLSSLEIVSYLVDNGSSVDVTNDNDEMPFALALKHHRSDVSIYLLKKTSHPKYEFDGQVDSPLHIAASRRSLDLAKALIKNGANVNAVDSQMMTSLQISLKCESHIPFHEGTVELLEFVSYLVEEGSQVNTSDNKGSTPLHQAAMYRMWNVGFYALDKGAQSMLDVGLYLLDQGADLNKEDARKRSVLHLAAEHSSFDFVKALVDKGANVNAIDDAGYTPLHMAILHKSFIIVQYLIKKGSEINKQTYSGCTPLHIAAECRTSDVGLYLLSKGADPNVTDAENNSPLHNAVLDSKLDLVKALVEKGAKLNSTNRLGNSTLHNAVNVRGSVFTRNLNIVRYLTDKGCNVNLQNCAGQTPLHLATLNYNLKICEYLLCKGADPNVTDRSNDSPLHLAIRMDSFSLIKTMVENGVKLNAVDESGKTILHYTCERLLLFESNLTFNRKRSFYCQIIKYLLQKGADPNHANSPRNSLLNLAVQADSLKVVKILIDKGAKIHTVEPTATSLLHIAADFSSFQLFKYLVEQGCHTDIPDGNGMLPIHLIAQRSKCSRDMSDMCLYLIRNGTDPNVTDAYKNTPLHLAVSSNCLDLVKTLVENKADVNALNKSKNTPLHNAAKHSSLEIVSFLVDNGSSVDVTNDNDEMPFSLAVKHDRSDVSIYLLKKISHPKEESYGHLDSLLHIAASSRSLDLAKALVKNGASVNAVDSQRMTSLEISLKFENYTPFHKGTVKVLEFVSFLVEEGSQINNSDNNGSTPLHQAAMYRMSDVGLYLLDQRADLNKEDAKKRSVLHLAAEYCSFDFVKALVDKGANVNAIDDAGYTPLHMAIRGESFKIVQYLIEKGSEINKQTYSGFTPLYIAAYCSTSDVCLYLLSKGADPNKTDAENNSPLHVAVLDSNHLDLVKTLVEKGAKLYTLNNSGNSALHNAVYPLEVNCIWKTVLKSSLKIVRYLIDKGFNANLQNKGGRTPLHLAALIDNPKIGEYLLCKGADPNVTDRSNDSPLHLAIQAGSFALIKTLVEQGAKVNTVNSDGHTSLYCVCFKLLEIAKSQEHNQTQQFFLFGNSKMPTYWDTSDIGVYLLQNGADPNVPDSSKVSPLHVIVQANALELVKTLVEKGANVNSIDSQGNTPLHNSFFDLHEAKSMDVVMYQSRYEIVSYLVQQGFNVNLENYYGLTPLHLGVVSLRPNHRCDMDEDIIRCLLDAGGAIDPEDHHGYTPLIYACSFGNVQNVECLLEKGANPNHGNITALHAAAGFHQPDILNILLRKDGNPKAVSNLGNTLIHVAVRLDLHYTYKDVFPYIFVSVDVLPSKAMRFWTICNDYLIGDSYYEKPSWFDLIGLIRPQMENVLDVLLSNGCSINVRNKAGQTPLHVCVQYNQLNNMRELLRRGADVSLVDEKGNSVLYDAVSRAMDEAVQTLVNAAAVDLENSYGVTASELAHAKMEYSFNENIKFKCSVIISILSTTNA